MPTRQGVNLTIKGIDTQNYRFTSLELTEVVGGALPKIVATYYAGTDDLNLDLKEVELNLSYLDYINMTFPAHVDQIDFGKNNITLYMTCAPLDFYQVSRSNTFLSLEESIKGLYWDTNIVSDITDNTPVELNQVNTTNSRAMFRFLSSLKSPSCYSFNLGRLKITDLSDPKPRVFINEEDKTNYTVEDTNNSIFNGRVKRLPFYDVPLTNVDGKISKTMVSWGDKTINVNEQNKDLLINVIENSKFYDAGNQAVRVTFKYLPEFMCGDIISIKLMDIEATEFLVVERLAVMKEDVQLSALLKPL